ncbi:hypothetical protein PCE1_004715 [Barthelona sp. PCE]
MPQPKSTVTEHFTFTPIGFNDKTIVSSNNESLNTNNVCLVGKHRGIIHGPPIDGSSAAENIKWCMLRHSLLDHNIFYRSARVGNAGTVVELFEFTEGKFFLTKRINLPVFDLPICLNKRFLFTKQGVDAFGIRLEFIDLQIDTIHHSDIVLRPNIEFFVHNGVAYMLCDLSVIAMILFTDQGLPTVSECTPLFEFQCFALDRTPGDNAMIIKRDNALFRPCVGDNDEVNLLPYDGKFPVEYNTKKIEFVRILDVTIPHPSVNFPGICCAEWDFVLLDGEVYCTSYGSQGGTDFYRLSKQELACLFVLNSEDVPFSHKVRSVKDAPIVFEYFFNSITILNTTQELQSMRRFYDSEAQRWDRGYVTENCGKIRVFIGETEMISFDQCEYSSEPHDTIFNRYHHATQQPEKQYSTVLNCAPISMFMIQFFDIVGNNVWFTNDLTDLNHMVLSQETGEITYSETYSLGECCDELITNQYCENEIFIVTESSRFFVRYEPEEEDYMFIELDYDEEEMHEPLFIDESLLVINSIAYEFDYDSVSNTWDVQLQYADLDRDNLFSPNRRVAVEYENFGDYNVNVNIRTFDGSGFTKETKEVNMIEFLSNCDVSVLSFNNSE